MNLAIPQWQDRVSPVFDVATHLLLIELSDGRETARREVALETTDPLERARRVAAEQVNVLICGAISWPLELALRSAGVQVIAQTCGRIDEVIRSFLLGELEKEVFRMPGCCGRRRFRGGRGGLGTRQNDRLEVPGGPPARMRRGRRGING